MLGIDASFACFQVLLVNLNLLRLFLRSVDALARNSGER